MDMKRLMILAVPVILLLAGCYPTTQLTGSWKNPNQPQNKYSSVFVAAITKNNIARSHIENQMASALNAAGISTTKSLDEFPPTFANDTVAREEIMKKVKKTGSKSILTITLLRKE